MTIINRKPRRYWQDDGEKHKYSDLNKKQIKNMDPREKKLYENEMCEISSLFENCKSSGSCYVSEINGIIFGGVNSRFWMLRKHFNSMNLSDIA